MERTARFWEIFRQNPDGSIEPTRVVQISGIQMGPGVRLGSGVRFGGIDLTQYIGRDLKIEERTDSTRILGIY